MRAFFGGSGLPMHEQAQHSIGSRFKRILWRRCAAVAAACTLLAATTGASNPADAELVAAQLRDKAMSGDNVAWSFVSEITTRFGPRPAGSESERRAAEWAAERLKALGFENVRIETFPLTAWVRGEERAQIVSGNPQPLSVVALGESPPTPSQGLEGDVIIFPTFDDLRAAPKGSLTGKIAMVSHKMVRTQDGSGYGPAVAARAVGPNEAAARGAIAFLLRSVGTDQNRLPHTGSTRYTGGRVLVPGFALSSPDADQIERLAALGEQVRVRLFSSSSYVTDAHSQNVVADIPGREKPQEIVLLGAHLDSWDQGTGAVDDAAGLAIITAAAKLIGDQPRKPKRTVRVVLFGSEEVGQPVEPFGVFGGHAYARAHETELPMHLLAGESDFGADRIYAFGLPEGAAESEFARSVLRVLTPIGVLASSEGVDDAGADVGPSVAAGVPPFALHQDGLRYFDLHHTANDTLDKIDRSQLDQNVAAWAAFVYLAAESDVDFRAPRGDRAR
jgi:hypothetical protein